MRAFLLRFIINILALGAADWLVSGIYVESYGALIWTAIVVGILNALIKPILFILTLPLNALIKPILFILTLPLTIFTLGLFTFVINGFILWLAGELVGGFHVEGLGAGILGAIVVSIVSIFMNWLINDHGRFEFRYYKY